ncbi:MAG TPA: TonB-dependent receptor [Burkholderiales bacterium]|nr:TonB-dependent receptor [Burkholderiales bacterium]
MKHEGACFVLAGTLLFVLSGEPSEAANPAAELEAPAVDVVGTTPLPGVGTPISAVPANVQTATDRQIEALPSPALPDFLERSMGGFVSSSSQGNPFQPDVSFRGFTASPLVGTPQGLSVFVDGVRVNEAFGDVVNWDLIPKNAISSVTVIPGSNPVFGLNTLGGALSVITKSGTTYPGVAAQAYGGAFGRRALEAEAGGRRGSADFFVAGTAFRESGWREHSSSDINQVFAKLGHEDARNDLDLSVSVADNTLAGTQALPLSMLDAPRQAYTWPDRTENHLAGVNLRASRTLDDANLLFANLYYRETRTRVFNSNVNDDCAAGFCDFTAVNNLTNIDQDRAGASLQYTRLAPVAGRKNQLTVGGNIDSARTRFTGESQPADFTPDRGTTSSEAFEVDTSVKARQELYSLYAQNILSLTEAWSVTLAASANGARVRIDDTSGTQPELNGDHSFFRVNPAAGVAWSPRRGDTWYANYSEGMRAPTPIELTCADPAAPCKLPNIFLADPPLKKVVSRTLELGLRQALGANLRASAALFRTDLSDDIQFISTSGATINAGFFQNVGDTRRQGLELALEGGTGRLRFAARYARVNATFESPFTAFSPNNSTADAAGDIHVESGNRIPGIPRDALKLRGELDAFERATFGATLLGFSSQYARGDENNQDRNGAVPGYAFLNLDARWRFQADWELFATVTNLLDRTYASFGVLGANFFTGPGNTFDATNIQPEQFRTPGLPRAAWIGLRYESGRKK